MSLSTRRCLAAITSHSHGLADAARDNLEAEVEHCPGWTVADLIWHVTEVHWFWKTIVAGSLASPPDESLRPQREPDHRLVQAFLAGVADLVDTLRAADQSTPVWTWATQKDVAFVTRHQVQEAAVHHWDAAFAASKEIVLEPDVAVDSIEEFLTFSLASAAEQAELGVDPLGQDLVLASTDGHGAWSIKDAAPEAPMTWVRGAEPGAATVSGTASELLLWLYDRTELPVRADDDLLVERFRKLRFTS